MTVRLAFSDDLYRRDQCHLRHLMEAMSRDPGVEHVDRGADADFAIYGTLGRKKTKGRKLSDAPMSVRIWRQDPHTGISDLGRENLLDPEMLETLLSTPGRRLLQWILGNELKKPIKRVAGWKCCGKYGQLRFSRCHIGSMG